MNLQYIAKAGKELSHLQDSERNHFLETLAKNLEENSDAIIHANKKDIEEARKHNLSEAKIERLLLTKNGLESIIQRLSVLQTIDAGIAEIIEKRKSDSGLLLKKVRVPLGVILVIYEARPEVTVDVAALCIKSGNAALLKGGSEAVYTNKALYRCIQKALKKAGLSQNTITLLTLLSREEIYTLLQENRWIDLVIARGGYEMVKDVLSHAKIPVLAHAAGGARIYVDRSANIADAINIILNAKTTKPAACNSVDTVLVHEEIAKAFISKLREALSRRKVEVITNATHDDFVSEFLGLRIIIQKVKNVQEAVRFIEQYGKKHSEGIIARDSKVINFFVQSVDAAALFVNCSTRFHDGFEFGLGSEMGIATGKLHARGPVGLKELTTYKWEVYGDGHIRK